MFTRSNRRYSLSDLLAGIVMLLSFIFICLVISKALDKYAKNVLENECIERLVKTGTPRVAITTHQGKCFVQTSLLTKE